MHDIAAQVLEGRTFLRLVLSDARRHPLRERDVFEGLP